MGIGNKGHKAQAHHNHRSSECANRTQTPAQINFPFAIENLSELPWDYFTMTRCVLAEWEGGIFSYEYCGLDGELTIS